jgi:hypothetical protein
MKVYGDLRRTDAENLEASFDRYKYKRGWNSQRRYGEGGGKQPSDPSSYYRMRNYSDKSVKLACEGACRQNAM